jgi:hypothetical protein
MKQILLFLLASAMLLAGDYQTITDSEGRTLDCLLLSKNQTSVLVRSRDDRKHRIPLDKLSEQSKILVEQHTYIIPEVLRILRDDSAWTAELRRADPNNGFSHSFEDEPVGRARTSVEKIREENKNREILQEMISVHGRLSEPRLGATSLSLSLAGFVEATARNRHNETIARIIRASFEDNQHSGFSNAINSLNEYLLLDSEEQLFTDLSTFIDKVYEEKGRIWDERMASYKMSYKVSGSFIEAAERLEWSISIAEEHYLQGDQNQSR